MKKFWAVSCVVLIIALIALLMYGCGLLPRSDKADKHNTQLNEMVKTRWTAYAAAHPSWEGDVYIYVMTPKGNYFSSSNLGNGNKSNVHFRGASCTKTYTAAAIMLLNQQGKLNIDDKITDPIPGSTEPYIPNTADYDIPNKDQITIRMVLKHRAGIWDISNSDIPATAEVPYKGQSYLSYVEGTDPTHTFTFDELVGVVASNHLSYFAPDTSYHYSDTGYSLLGKIIERVSGKRYGQFITQNLTIPNGLLQTSFPDLGTDNTIPAPFVRGYSYYRGKAYDSTQDNMTPHVAEGNVISTLSDLGNWTRKLFRGEAGPNAATVAMMEEGTEKGAYGLGNSYVKGLGFGHDGGHAGYSTVAKYDPAQDVTVIISAGAISFDDIVNYYEYLHDMGREAKNILGYSTAEVEN